MCHNIYSRQHRNALVKNRCEKQYIYSRDHVILKLLKQRINVDDNSFSSWLLAEVFFFGFYSFKISYTYLNKLPFVPDAISLQSPKMRQLNGPWHDIEWTSHILAKVLLEIRLLLRQVPNLSHSASISISPSSLSVFPEHIPLFSPTSINSNRVWAYCLLSVHLGSHIPCSVFQTPD